MTSNPHIAAPVRSLFEEGTPERGLLDAAEAVLARIEGTGYLVSTLEYVNLAAAVKAAGGTSSWKERVDRVDQ